LNVVSDLAALPPEALAAPAPGFAPGVAPSEKFTLLRAAFGQDEANYGAVCYPVDADGFVLVPLDAVSSLIERGGFALLNTEDEPISVGVIKLHHQDAEGCSYHGQRYPADENGDVLVPAEAAAELSAHNFVPVVRDPSAEPACAQPLMGSRSRKGLIQWPSAT
jgi:hypothetical protein